MGFKINGIGFILIVLGLTVAAGTAYGTGQSLISEVPLFAGLALVLALDLGLRLREGVEELLTDECGGHLYHLPLWALSTGGLLIAVAIYFNWV